MACGTARPSRPRPPVRAGPFHRRRRGGQGCAGADLRVAAQRGSPAVGTRACGRALPGARLPASPLRAAVWSFVLRLRVVTFAGPGRRLAAVWSPRWTAGTWTWLLAPSGRARMQPGFPGPPRGTCSPSRTSGQRRKDLQARGCTHLRAGGKGGWETLSPWVPREKRTVRGVPGHTDGDRTHQLLFTKTAGARPLPAGRLPPKAENNARRCSANPRPLSARLQTVRLRGKRRGGSSNNQTWNDHVAWQLHFRCLPT